MQELKLGGGGREHNKNREGYGGRVGPQRVRGRAPVGGSGGRSPLTENGFNSFNPPQTLWEITPFCGHHDDFRQSFMHIL